MSQDKDTYFLAGITVRVVGMNRVCNTTLSSLNNMTRATYCRTHWCLGIVLRSCSKKGSNLEEHGFKHQLSFDCILKFHAQADLIY